MNSKIIYSAVLLFAGCFVVKAQQQDGAWKSVPAAQYIETVKRLNQKYLQAEAYEYSMHYTSYENHTTDQVFEKSTGYVKKVKSSYYSKTLGMQLIQNERCRLFIDSNSKVVAVSKPSGMQSLLAEHEKLLAQAQEIKARTEAAGVRYKIRFPDDAPVTAFEMLVDKNGWVKETETFYRKTQMNEDGEETPAYPRLKIVYSTPKMNIAYKKSDFDESRYVKKTAEGYKLAEALQEEYVLYQ